MFMLICNVLQSLSCIALLSAGRRSEAVMGIVCGVFAMVPCGVTLWALHKYGGRVVGRDRLRL